MQVKGIIIAMVCCLLIFGSTGISYAIGQGDYTLQVISNDRVVKELSGHVVIPFYSEYKLKLSNFTDRRCAVEVFIDDIDVASGKKFIISSNQSIDLERFVVDSLHSGSKFKFVPASHPEVDNPNNINNGTVVVRFYAERDVEEIIIPYIQDMTYTWDSLLSISTLNTSLTSVSYNEGATIGGSVSYQSFKNIDFDSEDHYVELSLKLIGRE